MTLAAILVFHSSFCPLPTRQRGVTEPHFPLNDPNYTAWKSKIISTYDLRFCPELPTDEVKKVRHFPLQKKTAGKTADGPGEGIWAFLNQVFQRLFVMLSDTLAKNQAPFLVDLWCCDLPMRAEQFDHSWNESVQWLICVCCSHFSGCRLVSAAEWSAGTVMTKGDERRGGLHCLCQWVSEKVYINQTSHTLRLSALIHLWSVVCAVFPLTGFSGLFPTW